MSVCPHGTTRLPLQGFLRNLIIDYFVFEKSIEIIHVSLISDNVTVTLHKRQRAFMAFRLILLRMRNVLYKNCTENQNKSILCSIIFLRKIMLFMRRCGKRRQNQTSRSSCPFQVYRHTLRICNACSFSTVTMVTRMLLNITFIHITSGFYNLPSLGT